MRVTAANIFFDTGASFNYIPPTEHKAFINAIKKTKKCNFNKVKDTHICDCKSTED